MSASVTRFPKAKKARRRRAARLVCPAHVQGDARAEWDRILTTPAAARIGAEHQATLEAYVMTYGRWRAAEAHVAVHGPIVPSPRTGVPMHNPMMSLASKERDAMLRLADALGLTPRATGFESRKEAEDESWGDLLA
jgi:P27 family predicted phage terminase small subunit